jgi:hypothetical protein
MPPLSNDHVINSPSPERTHDEPEGSNLDRALLISSADPISGNVEELPPQPLVFKSEGEEDELLDPLLPSQSEYTWEPPVSPQKSLFFTIVVIVLDFLQHHNFVPTDLFPDTLLVLEDSVKEAECLLDIARAKRNSYRAEETLIERRMQEAVCRQELCRILLNKVKKKLTEANSSVGRARLDLDEVQKTVASARARFGPETTEAIEKHLSRFKNVKRRKCTYCNLFSVLKLFTLNR